jgi:ornithine carbamoyltransferase
MSSSNGGAAAARPPEQATSSRGVGPRELWPPDDVVATANELGDRSTAHVMVTDVWVSMGVTLLRSYQVNADLMSAPATPQLSSCTACPHSTGPTPLSAPR